MNFPSFSICIPNFNYAGYVGETIQSVLDQTYQNFEIIVVDNASTDDSVQVIRQKMEQNNRISLHINPFNVGFGPNLDRAASLANNDFIIVLSSDDLMLPNALEEYAKAIQSLGEKSNNVIISSEVNIIDSDGSLKSKWGKNAFIPSNQASIAGLTSLLNMNDVSMYDAASIFKSSYEQLTNPCAFATTCYSKNVYQKIGGFSSIHPTGPDGHLVYKALLHGCDLVFFEKPLFSYRIHGFGQFNQAQKNLNINYLINYYFFTICYPAKQLEQLNIDLNKVQKRFINDYCLVGGIDELAKGRNVYALRHVAFGIATYPAHAFSNWKTYALFTLSILGPIGVWVASKIRK